MRRFSLFKRNGIYYIRLYNTKTGKYLTAKSSGKTDRDEAAVVAVDWLKNGIPEKVAESRLSPAFERSLCPMMMYQGSSTF